MNKNIKIFSSILMFSILFLATLVSSAPATITLDTPATGSNHSGTMDITVTTDMVDAENVTIYYDAAGGAATTLLIQIQNTTGDQTSFDSSGVSISGLSDLTTYNFTAQVNNVSNLPTNSTGSFSVTIDNTNPIALLTVNPTSQTFDRPLTYKCTTSDALDSFATTTFNVTHPSGDTTSVTSLTDNDAGDKSFLDTDFGGDYIFTCLVTDASGNTLTKTQTVAVASLGGAPAGSTPTDDKGISSNVIWLIVAIIAIGIVLKANQK